MVDETLTRAAMFPAQVRKNCRVRPLRFAPALLALWLAIGGSAWAQDSTVAGDSAPPVAAEDGYKFPVDLAGYVGFRYVTAAGQTDGHSEYSSSIFLSKTLGRFRFHSEFNITNASRYDSEGINLFHPRPDLKAKLDSATLTYNFRDWLQIAAGVEFVPTYWRMHRYQSTTLTVADPIIDQTVFPTAFKGGMIKGDRYFKYGGFSYELYGGESQRAEYLPGGQSTFVSREPVLGAKFVAHVPTGAFLDSCDIGFQRMHAASGPGDRDELYGFEARVVKSRVELLAEFAHASMDIRNGIRTSFRQGYYVQGSYRLVRNLYAVARADRANLDSRFEGPNDLKTLLLGLTFRPIAALSLKAEVSRDLSPLRFQGPGGGPLPGVGVMASGPQQPSTTGVSIAIVYFFHLP